jgi:hypothetical protein
MTVKSEGIADLYFNMLRSTTNPGSVLAQLYASIFSVPVSRTDIAKLGHLVKIFGKTAVFFSIIDIGKREDIKELPYGLLYKICVDRLESAFEAEITTGAYESLDKKITEALKFKASMKKIDVEKSMRLIEEVDDE